MPVFLADRFHVNSFGIDDRQQVHHRNWNIFTLILTYFYIVQHLLLQVKFMLVIPNYVLLGYDTHGLVDGY